jgi:N-acetylglucosaminyldiphosphoundecaprenol N-acetyl-beta-D-mannosaminyltransferase
LAGASILEWILEISRTTEISLAIVGGQERSHEMFRERIIADFAGRVRATYTAREFSAIPTPEDVRFCLDFLGTANADFVIYALGFPKQERLAWEMRKRNVRGFHLSLGAAVDYSAGIRMRSPIFLQKLGLEWAWRFLSEPKRLFRRYILEGIPEAMRLLLGVIRK